MGGLTERGGINSSVTYYKPSIGYRVLTNQGRLLLKMSFQRDAVSLGLLQHGVTEMTVAVLDSPPDCFAELPSDVGARSTAAMRLLVKDLSDILPKGRSHDDQLPSNADHQVVCRQVGTTADSLQRCLVVQRITFATISHCLFVLANLFCGPLLHYYVYRNNLSPMLTSVVINSRCRDAISTHRNADIRTKRMQVLNYFSLIDYFVAGRSSRHTGILHTALIY